MRLRDRSSWRVADIAVAAAAAPASAGGGGIVVGPGVDLGTHIPLLSNIAEIIREITNISLARNIITLWSFFIFTINIFQYFLNTVSIYKAKILFDKKYCFNARQKYEIKLTL